MKHMGRYTLTRELGRGGMGIVYEARDPDGGPVALKVLLRPNLSSPEDLVRFRLEGDAGLWVNHPNIVRVFDVCRDRGRPFIVMELVEGENLSDRLKRGPLDPERAVALFADLAGALETCTAAEFSTETSNPTT